MGFGNILETTAKVHHECIVPADITLTSALAVLHDHHNLIKMDPHLLSYEELPSSSSAPETKLYSITDKLENIPKTLSPEIHSDLQCTNLPNGIHTHVKSSLGLVMDTHLIMEERKGEMVVSRDIEIRCSRLWMSFVKGQCDASWKEIYGKFMETVRERQASLRKEEDPENLEDVVALKTALEMASIPFVAA